MKKFKYLIFIFVLMLCMIPNVNALEFDSTRGNSNVWVRRGNGLSNYYQTSQSKEFDGTTYWATYNDSDYIYAHTTNLKGFSNLEYNKTYVLTFFIQGGPIVYYPDVGPYEVPVVRIDNDLFCGVKPLGYSDWSNEISSTYSVTCDNFIPTKDDYNITIWTTTNVNAGAVWYGVSSKIGYARLNGSFEDIVTSNEEIVAGVDNLNETQKETNNKLDDLNDNITSSDTTNSQNQANSFFEGFDTNDYGLSDIVTMPLELIRGLTSNNCVALSLTLPFVNKTFNLPCMSSIYQEYFGSFYDLYQLVTFGFISYWVIVRIFNLVKDFKNPDHDEIEVLDL